MSRVHARRQSRGRFPQTPRVPPGRFKATLFYGVRCCLISEWGCSIRVGVAQTPVEQSMKSRKFAKKIPEFYILLYGLTVIYL